MAFILAAYLLLSIALPPDNQGGHGGQNGGGLLGYEGQPGNQSGH